MKDEYNDETKRWQRLGNYQNRQLDMKSNNTSCVWPNNAVTCNGGSTAALDCCRSAWRRKGLREIRATYVSVCLKAIEADREQGWMVGRMQRGVWGGGQEVELHQLMEGL